MDADANDIDGDENPEENEPEEQLSSEEKDGVDNKDLDSFEDMELESETVVFAGSESSLNDSRELTLQEEKRWKGY